VQVRHFSCCLLRRLDYATSVALKVIAQIESDVMYDGDLFNSFSRYEDSKFDKHLLMLITYFMINLWDFLKKKFERFKLFNFN
jgi:hypothetical protein